MIDSRAAEEEVRGESAGSPRARVAPSFAPAGAAVHNRAAWLIDNAEAYGLLLQSLHAARKSIHIAQLAFDADCAAYSSGSLEPLPSRETVIAETLIDLATDDGPEIRIVLNATWILNTARPLRKFFARRGVSRDRIQVRGLSRFPHFMHAKLVLIDEREAFLLGSPFVNSYWDDGGHLPFDARRPLRELGGRPLHDVSVHLQGTIVRDLEAMFTSVWQSCEKLSRATTDRNRGAIETPHPPSASPTVHVGGARIVCDAPDDILSGLAKHAMKMLAELLFAIARARTSIYIEHQYLTSRPVVAALAEALRRAPGLAIILVLNQNPDLTAYRVWQNGQLEKHGLLSHPRVGVFTLWSTDAHSVRDDVTLINQLFIHSKVVVIDDEWAAVGTSNLDGVSMGDYGDDFASALGRRVFRGVRNVEVNVIIEACEITQGGGPSDTSARDVESIIELRERLWCEHLGVTRATLRGRRVFDWLGMWREVACANVRALAEVPARAFAVRRLVGRVLPYSVKAYPRDQLVDLGISLESDALQLCYNPTWFGVFASPHWIRNIF